MPYKSKRGVSTQVKKYVQKTISKNLETKFIFKNWNELAVDNTAGTPVQVDLIDCATGDSQNTRTGNQLTMTGYYGKLWFTYGDTTNVCRVILYIPNDSDDVLSIDTYQAVDFDKYTVLMDRYVLLSSASDQIKQITLKKSFASGARKGARVQFSSTGTGAVEKNNLKLYVVSDSDVAPDPAMSGFIRTYFKDG